MCDTIYCVICSILYTTQYTNILCYVKNNLLSQFTRYNLFTFQTQPFFGMHEKTINKIDSTAVIWIIKKKKQTKTISKFHASKIWNLFLFTQYHLPFAFPANKINKFRRLSVRRRRKLIWKRNKQKATNGSAPRGGAGQSQRGIFRALNFY